MRRLEQGEKGEYRTEGKEKMRKRGDWNKEKQEKGETRTKRNEKKGRPEQGEKGKWLYWNIGEIWTWRQG